MVHKLLNHHGHFTYFYFCHECHGQIFSTLRRPSTSPSTKGDQTPVEEASKHIEGDSSDIDISPIVQLQFVTYIFTHTQGVRTVIMLFQRLLEWMLKLLLQTKRGNQVIFPVYREGKRCQLNCVNGFDQRPNQYMNCCHGQSILSGYSTYRIMKHFIHKMLGRCIHFQWNTFSPLNVLFQKFLHTTIP